VVTRESPLEQVIHRLARDGTVEKRKIREGGGKPTSITTIHANPYTPIRLTGGIHVQWRQRLRKRVRLRQKISQGSDRNSEKDHMAKYQGGEVLTKGHRKDGLRSGGGARKLGKRLSRNTKNELQRGGLRGGTRNTSIREGGGGN